MSEQYKTYFFQYIQREIGAPANDWKQVLESLPQQGFLVNPKPGQVLPSSPHHGIAIMIDAGGNARGRIWLPTDTYVTDPSGNQWFTHEFQVIADGPQAGSFVWAWQDKGGAPVRAFEGSTTPPVVVLPPVQVPPPVDYQPQIDALEAKVERLFQALVVTNDKFNRLKAEGRTGASLYHSHAVSLDVKVTE